MSKYILAIDQGTTSSRSILFDHQGLPAAQVSEEFRQIYPKPGWVEHDPIEIWESQLSTIRAVIEKTSAKPSDIAAVGITNQRETTILWDRNTGKPVYNAIVWQCRRTAAICDDLRDSGAEPMVLEKTGLVLDAYFSATKIKWLLDNVGGLRGRAEAGEICFGTVDSWLLFNLTGGKVHATDLSNASRSMIFNIRSMEWDEELLDMLGIPKEILPDVRPSSSHFGVSEKNLFGAELPIAGMAGDQQAALFGQGCFEKGLAKNTYGTGCFMLMNTGSECMTSENGLLTTLAWGLDQKIDYALEGSVFVAGAAVQWLRDEMGLIDDAAQSEALAIEAGDSDGVYFVPAFVGLGAPYWDMYARGTIVGLTRGSGRAHIVRATLEAIAYQVKDLVVAMEADSGIKLKELRVDGGAVANSFLMQFQADILGVPVVVSKVAETTALGAAYLAGLTVGFWSDRAEISYHWQEGKRYIPQMPPEKAACRYAGWKRAIERSRGWAVGHDNVDDK